MPRRVAINASPLIYLAKVSLLEFLRRIYDEVLTTRLVISECVDKGKKAGYEDALLIEKLVKEGLIRIIELDEKAKIMAKKLARETRIHIGEATVILLAKDENIEEILVDDKRARRIAKLHGLKPRAMLSIILEFVTRHMISIEDAEKYIKKLIDEGFRVGIEVYNRVLEALKSLKN